MIASLVAHSNVTSLLPRAAVTLEIDWRNMLLFSWDHNRDLSVLTVGPFNLCFECTREKQ